MRLTQDPRSTPTARQPPRRSPLQPLDQPPHHLRSSNPPLLSNPNHLRPLLIRQPNSTLTKTTSHTTQPPKGRTNRYRITDSGIAMREGPISEVGGDAISERGGTHIRATPPRRGVPPRLRPVACPARSEAPARPIAPPRPVEERHRCALSVAGSRHRQARDTARDYDLA